MEIQSNSLDELRNKKNLLKKEIKELENLITFKNKKESLSIITQGFTDKFLKESETENGETKLSLDTQNIIKEIADNLKKSISGKSILSLANDSLKSGLVETVLKMKMLTMFGNFTKKNATNKNWKKKLLGFVLISILPYILKYIRKKFNDYKEHKNNKRFRKVDLT